MVICTAYLLGHAMVSIAVSVFVAVTVRIGAYDESYDPGHAFGHVLVLLIGGAEVALFTYGLYAMHRSDEARLGLYWRMAAVLLGGVVLFHVGVAIFELTRGAERGAFVALDGSGLYTLPVNIAILMGLGGWYVYGAKALHEQAAAQHGAAPPRAAPAKPRGATAARLHVDAASGRRAQHPPVGGGAALV